MAIRITDNLMNRPMEPGSGVRGLDTNVEQRLGNNVAQVGMGLDARNAPTSQVLNPMAAKESIAEAGLVEAATKSVTDISAQFEALRLADEDGRATRARVNVMARENDLRNNLAGQQVAEGWDVEQYTQNYKDGLQAIVDDETSKANLSNKMIVKNFETNMVGEQAQRTMNFQEKTIKPLIVSRAMADVDTNAAEAIRVAVNSGDQDSLRQAANIIEGMTLQNPRLAAVAAPEQISAKRDVLYNQLARSFAARTDNVLLDPNNGALSAMTGEAQTDKYLYEDARNQLTNVYQSLPFTNEAEREKARDKALGMLDRQYDRNTSEIQNAAKVKEREDLKAGTRVISSVGIELDAMGDSHALTLKDLNAAEKSLLEHPMIKDNPDLVIKSQEMIGRARNRVEENRHRANVMAQLKRLGHEQDDTGTQALTDQNFALAVHNQYGAKATLQSVLSTPGGENFIHQWMVSTKPTYMPSEVKNSVKQAVVSGDEIQAKTAIAFLNKIKDTNPLALGSMPPEVVDIMERSPVVGIAEARKQVATASRMTDDERKIAKKQSDDYLRPSPGSKSNPVAELVSRFSGKQAGSVTPQYEAAWRQQYESHVQLGRSPEAAARLATSTMETTSGVTKLGDFDGKAVRSTTSAERVFNATSEAIEKDVREKLPSIPKDAKISLEHAGIDSQGNDRFSILYRDSKGNITVASDEHGSPLRYRFDARNTSEYMAAMAQEQMNSKIDRYNAAMEQKVGPSIVTNQSIRGRGGVPLKSTKQVNRPWAIARGTKDPLSTAGIDKDVWKSIE
jgi:hypothetical protein